MKKTTDFRPTIVRTGRGLSIAGTRITLYQIMDYLPGPGGLIASAGYTISLAYLLSHNIHISHNSEKVENEGSELGLRLVAALKDFGLVNHSIWVEIKNK